MAILEGRVFVGQKARSFCISLCGAIETHLLHHVFQKVTSIYKVGLPIGVDAYSVEDGFECYLPMPDYDGAILSLRAEF
jgi:hypothetical protein